MRPNRFTDLFPDVKPLFPSRSADHHPSTDEEEKPHTKPESMPMVMEENTRISKL